MNEEPYTNREIDTKHQEIMTTLGRIETQTTKTNGRVGKLENWRSWMTGGLAVLGFILTAAGIPLAYWLITTLVNLNTTINNSIDTKLSSAKIEIQPIASP